MITTRERLVRKTDTAPGGNADVSTPADLEDAGERGDLHRAEPFGVAGDLRRISLRWLARATNSDVNAVPHRRG